jgi:hypothetical protein
MVAEIEGKADYAFPMHLLHGQKAARDPTHTIEKKNKR